MSARRLARRLVGWIARPFHWFGERLTAPARCPHATPEKPECDKCRDWLRWW